MAQAAAIALGTYWLLGDESTAEAWIAWAKRKAEEAASKDPAAGRVPAPRRALRPAPVPAAAGARQARPARGRRDQPRRNEEAARDAAWRATPEATIFRVISGG